MTVPGSQGYISLMWRSIFFSVLYFASCCCVGFVVWVETRRYTRYAEDPAHDPRQPSPPVNLRAAGDSPPRREIPRLQSILVTVLVTVLGGAIMAAASGVLSYNATNATTQAQIYTLTQRADKQDAAIAANTAARNELIERLPKEFKLRADIDHDEELVRRTREEDEDRFARRQALLNEYRAPTKLPHK